MRINNAHFRGFDMVDIFDRNAPKKATNLTVNSSLLAEARNLKLNLSATLESALEDELKEAKRRSWLKNNKKAIENCNSYIEKHGLFADKFRKF